MDVTEFNMRSVAIKASTNAWPMTPLNPTFSLIHLYCIPLVATIISVGLYIPPGVL